MRESEVLSHIFRQNNRLPNAVTIPPGDDMGAIRIGGRELLVTVDQLIDGVHFRLGQTPLDLIGRKAITRNLSDVAAMAALPVAGVAAAALPKSFAEEQARTLFDSMRQTADHYDCPLIGGDLSIHDGPLTLTVTVLATPAGIAPIRRSGAKIGDIIAVTGRLGRAWTPAPKPAHLGREVAPDIADVSRGVAEHHLTFEPRIQLARHLVQLSGGLHSMIDISDGLATDLGHICRMSNVGAEIRPADLPLRNGATAHQALTDGEDYELLFTLSTSSAAKLPSEIDGVPITPIGRVVEGDSMFLIEQGRQSPLRQSGWEHQT